MGPRAAQCASWTGPLVMRVRREGGRLWLERVRTYFNDNRILRRSYYRRPSKLLHIKLSSGPKEKKHVLLEVPFMLFCYWTKAPMTSSAKESRNHAPHTTQCGGGMALEEKVWRPKIWRSWVAALWGVEPGVGGVIGGVL